MTAGSDGPVDPRDRRPTSFDDFKLALGDLMRGERATLGKSLLDVQRDLKIKAEYLAGIEDADLAAFETPGFIKGYIRSYARYLGMNPDWAYARFCEETGFAHVSGLEAKPVRRPQGAGGRRREGRPHAGDAILARSPLSAAPRAGVFHGVQPGAVGSLLVLGLLAGGLGFGGWSVLQEIQRVTLAPVEVPFTQPASLPGSPVIEGPEIETGAPTVAALERLYRPQALDTPVLVPRDRPIAMLDPDAQGAFAHRPDAASLAPPAPPDPAQVAGIGAAPPEGVALAAAEAPQVFVPAPPEVVMFARRPAWVRVRAADGSVIFEKIMEQGERFVLPAAEAPPTLRAGNSGAVFFAINGEAYGPAGAPGSVVSGIVLSADALVDAFAEADLSTDTELARLAALAAAPAAAPPAN